VTDYKVKFVFFYEKSFKDIKWQSLVKMETKV
jgi:hypothetical protein